MKQETDSREFTSSCSGLEYYLGLMDTLYNRNVAVLEHDTLEMR